MEKNRLSNLTLFIFLALSSFIYLQNKQVLAVPYDNCEDWCENGGYGGSGTYMCNGGNYCCTGHGCPSQGCPSGSGWIANINTMTCTRTVWVNTTCAQWSSWYCVEHGWVTNVYWDDCPPPNPYGRLCRYTERSWECTDWDRDCYSWNGYYQTQTAALDPYYANSTCGRCPSSYEGSTPCYTAAMSGSFSTTGPADGTVYPTTQTSVGISWNAGTINWGTCCGSCARVYEVFARTNTGAGWSGWSRVAGPVSNSTLSASISVASSTTYEVFVRASNGSAGTIDSNRITFSVSPPSVDVRGYIWDSTGLACSGDKVSNEILNADLSASFTPRITDSSGAVKNGTWNPSGYSGYSYNIPFVSITNNPQTLVAALPEPAGLPNFKYYLTCVEGGGASIISSSSATANVTSVPVQTIHLGYKLISNGWFQAISGDVFGGCDVLNCSDGISVGVPQADVLGNFRSYLIAGLGTVFSDSGLSVTNDAYSQDNNRRIENMGSQAVWPDSFTFTAPASATQITDCAGMFNGGGISARRAYKASVSCVQTGLNNVSGTYNIAAEGVAIVYVEGAGTIRFENAFQSNTATKRVLFITEGSVHFDAGLGVAAPDANALDPLVDAAIVSAGSIEFETDGTSTDTSIVVEGPLVSKDGTIDFNRDRGINNTYPAQVVVYNPIYMRDIQTLIDTGIAQVDIYWFAGEE